MSFDVLARHYRWMEWVLAGRKLQRCRTAFLEAIPVPHHALIYGEGNGRFLAALCRRFPEAQATVVDSSAQMLAQAARRLRAEQLESPRVHFLHADALLWVPPTATFDLVVTHFFLDCFREDQLQGLIPVIAQAAQPEAHWLLADFKMAASGPARLRSRAILWIMYTFFRWVTRLPARRLTSPDPFLSATGFTRRQTVESDWGMLHTDWWQRPAGTVGGPRSL